MSPRFRASSPIRGVILGDESQLYSRSVWAEDFHWVSLPPCGPLAVTAKTRYSQTEASGTLYLEPDGGVRVEFDQPQRAVTAGQSLVCYCGERSRTPPKPPGRGWPACHSFPPAAAGGSIGPGKDKARNQVILGDECQLYSRSVWAEEFHWVSLPPCLEAKLFFISPRFRASSPVRGHILGKSAKEAYEMDPVFRENENRQTGSACLLKV